MPKKSRKNVGLIGLGIIGSRVANALRASGFHVYVWNRTPRAAPNFLGSPLEVAELCDIIQIFVSDAQALFEVIEPMADALTPNHVILCNSTIGPEATLDAARMVLGRGAQFLDAPFTGSKVAAEKRELVYFIGGDDKTLQLVQPVLSASSKAIVKIGKVGDAAVIKVATNMISAVTVQALAEAYAIVKSSGINPLALANALKNHAVRSGVSDAKLAKILEHDYDPHFSLKHMFKDVQLGIHIANRLDIDLPATTSTAGIMYGGLTRGWADQDFSVLARAYQKEEAPPALQAPPPVPHPVQIPPPLPVTPHSHAIERQPPQFEFIVPAQAPTPVAPSVEKAPEPPPAAEPVPPPAPVAPATPADPVTAAPETTAPPQADQPTPGEPPKDAPAEPSRPPTFVRLRRWFGTGPAN
jgi:3-hydroxyisobutyrate dehydrogenase-like beta-hydroxyacid dehydrogenase